MRFKANSTKLPFTMAVNKNKYTPITASIDSINYFCCNNFMPMLSRNSFLLIAFIILAQRSLAQNSKVPQQKGKIEIISDERLEDLMKTRSSINKNKPVIEGYRVQIYFASGNNSKKTVQDVRTQFLTKHPLVGAYIIYQAPNFKVRVGDFRTKSEAYKFYKQIKDDFPSSFLVLDEINLPKIE